MKSVDITRWKSSSHSKYNLGYHIIFCPKYRRKVLIGDIETRLSELIITICEDLNVELVTKEIMPDHVHLFVKSTPVLAPHYLIQQIKGKTSSILRKEFKTLRTRIPTLWTRSYFIESVGVINEETIKKYIENQKKV